MIINLAPADGGSQQGFRHERVFCQRVTGSQGVGGPIAYNSLAVNNVDETELFTLQEFAQHGFVPVKHAGVEGFREVGAQSGNFDGAAQVFDLAPVYLAGGVQVADHFLLGLLEDAIGNQGGADHPAEQDCSGERSQCGKQQFAADGGAQTVHLTDLPAALAQEYSGRTNSAYLTFL